MPRQARFYYPGAVLHVIQRGINRAPVFTRARDYRCYLDCLLEAMRRHDVSIHAYVLMTNHVHLLVSPGHAHALPQMMQMLGRKYVGWFNFQYQRTGTLWEGRYKATLVESEVYLFTCLRYIELNPVRACLVAAPADYRWSSHRANACGEGDSVVTPHPLYLGLGAHADERRHVYRRTFGQPEPKDAVNTIRDATQYEWALGSPSFCKRVEVWTGRRADRLPTGRPRVSAN